MTFSVIGDSFRLDRTARKAHQDRLDMGNVPATHPLVEVHARKAHDNEINGGARDLGNFLERQGFRVVYVYSKGTRIHALSGKPIGTSTSTISMRAWREHLTEEDGRVGAIERVVGVWYLLKSGWQVQGAWYWFHGFLPKNLGITGVRERLDVTAL